MKCLPNPGGLFQQDRTHLRKIERTLAAMEQYNDDKMKKSESQQRADAKAKKVEESVYS